MLPLGRDTAVNGKQTLALAFTSRRQVKSILQEQVRLWEEKGLLAFGTGTSARGVAMALDRASSLRYLINAWNVPPSLRRAAGGSKVQGIFSVSSGAERLDTTADEKQGIVPGVPVYPGGKPGAVFSSQDGAQKTYSATYRNPVTVQESVAFYRQELSAKGWQERDGGLSPRDDFAVGHLTFERDEEEVVLLFSPLRLTNDAETLTFVTLGSKWQAPRL